MVAALLRDYDKRPLEWRADGGYVNIAALERQEPAGAAMYVPPPKPRAKAANQAVDKNQTKTADQPGPAPRDRYAPWPSDRAEAAAWRQRMGADAAKDIYKERAATAECVHAQARNHGLRQLNVRGLPKAWATALWHGLAHNFRRTVALHAAAAAGLPTTIVFGRRPAAA